MACGWRRFELDPRDFCRRRRHKLLNERLDDQLSRHRDRHYRRKHPRPDEHHANCKRRPTPSTSKLSNVFKDVLKKLRGSD